MKIFGKYMCLNCGNRFKTGAFCNDKEEIELYDDICPYCGAPADETFWEWLRYGGIKVWYHKIKKGRNKK